MKSISYKSVNINDYYSNLPLLDAPDCDKDGNNGTNDNGRSKQTHYERYCCREIWQMPHNTFTWRWQLMTESATSIA